ncbi:hypothetical protein ABPG74_022439 [Tetrahymena malaccensis]
MDLFMVIEQVSYQGGNPGLGGKGGSGGLGGRGGIGGSGYSWSESCNGVTIFYTNPGGINGPCGKDGKRGEDGLNGDFGQNGSFNYILEKKKYSQRYNLIVNWASTIKSDDGIIEPGEKLVINSMQFSNNGGMHTPIAQRIGLYLQSNEWIIFNSWNTVYIDKSLQINQAFQITQQNPLIFQIKDNIYPTIDTTFKSNAVVDYRASVERVNKEFKSVADRIDNYTIRFPVEISPIQVLRSIRSCEEAPFVVSIWNRSTKSIGINHNRLLNFRLIQLDRVQKMEFLPKFDDDDEQKRINNSSEWGQKARDQKNFVNPKMEENSYCIIEQDFIASLGPNEKKLVSGTIRFKDADLPLYTKINLQAKLDLGYYHKQAEQFQNIQTRNFQIQLTEGFSYDPKSEFLLIFNYDTSRSLIDSCKQFAMSLGSSIDLWNISNYQGFAFDFISHEGQPFYNLYQNKVVFILSNEFQLINNQRTNSVKQIKEPLIYKAIKDYNISFYILGPSSNYNQFWMLHPNCDFDNSTAAVNEETQLYKKFSTNLTEKKEFIQINNCQEAENIEPENYLNSVSYNLNVHSKLFCCSEPSHDRLLNKAISILNKIDKLNPQYSHILTYTYNPQLIKEDTFLKEYKLGQITVIESLRKDCATLITRSQNYLEQELCFYDKFNLIKLLPFDKKCYYLKNVMDDFSQAKIFIKAIVSDLCDEYVTYQDQKQNTMQLQVTLKMWQHFMEFNIQELFQAEQQAQFLPSDIYSDKNLDDSKFQNNQEKVPKENEQNIEQDQKNPVLENINEIYINKQNEKIKINNQPGQQKHQNDNNMQTSSTSSQGKVEIETLNKIKYYLIEYLISFKAALKTQVSLSQKCCCQAVAKVNTHCQTIIDAVLLKKLQISENLIKQFSKQQTERYELKKKIQVFKKYQYPYLLNNINDHVQQNNFLLQSRVYNTRNFPSFDYNFGSAVYIQDDSFVFNDPNSLDTNYSKRLNKISKFENQIYFDQ